MKIIKLFTLIALSLLVISCEKKDNKTQELAHDILADTKIDQVEAMARDLMKKGFDAGSGYPMVWSRDLNTFIELSCEEYDTKIIRENLLMFFHFQQENGELLDGFVPKEAFNWGDPNTYQSASLPGHLGFKNTVETDQETSLVQAIFKYIAKTNDRSILNEEINGVTAFDRLEMALNYLYTERYSEKYGLITGATTFDWGDVQVEGGAVVDVDDLTHWSIDIYDNAMLILALNHMSEFAPTSPDKDNWTQKSDKIFSNCRKYLWDAKNQKFIPHLYLDGSPFEEEFDENAIHYHGGTAIAIEAGLLSRAEIRTVTDQMIKNVELSGAPTIGLTLYPPYPSEVLGKNISAPYEYQNGGDWTWFGARMIQQLIIYGFIEDAYNLSKPMFERVVANQEFYEWYRLDGSPAGSAAFKGSAGALSKAGVLLKTWAKENQ